jgi:hypothetical protein
MAGTFEDAVVEHLKPHEGAFNYGTMLRDPGTCR